MVFRKWEYAQHADLKKKEGKGIFNINPCIQSTLPQWWLSYDPTKTCSRKSQIFVVHWRGLSNYNKWLIIYTLVILIKIKISKNYCL